MKPLNKMLSYAGSTRDSKEWIGLTIIYTGIFTFLITLLFFLIFRNIYLTGFVLIASIVGVPIFRLLLIELAIENRKREVERVLPDFLRVVASNISAGLTPLVALRAAARPEFGVLSDEIRYFTTRVMGSRSVEDVFDEIQSRIQSTLLSRVFKAFLVSLRSGGNLVKTLDSSASDIQRMYELHESLIARTSMYIMFILFGVIITMPFLLAVSINILQIMSGISTSVNSLNSSYMEVMNPQINISVLQIVSIIVLVGASLSASILISVINTGNRITGVKYFLPLMIASLFVFYLSKDYIVPLLISALGGNNFII